MHVFGLPLSPLSPFSPISPFAPVDPVFPFGPFESISRSSKFGGTKLPRLDHHVSICRKTFTKQPPLVPKHF